MKKIKYLVIVIILFVSFSTETNAITFYKRTSSPTGVYFNDKLEYSTSVKTGFPSSSQSLIKLYRFKKNDAWDFAYCSNRKLNFYNNYSNSSNKYKEDSTYKSSKQCIYKLQENGVWKTYYGGDCSKLVGYVIQNAYKQAGKTAGIAKKFAYAQASLWVFLRKFTYGNASYLQDYNKIGSGWDNSNIKAIIRAAWSEYYNNEVKGVSATVENPETVYTIEKPDKLKLYYYPDFNQCGSTSGIYKSEPIKITNPSGSRKVLKLSVKSESVVLKIKQKNKSGNYGAEQDSFEINLDPNTSVEFILTAKDYLTKTPKIYISGLKEGTTSTVKYTSYDSRRWKKQGGPKGQGLIILTSTPNKDKKTSPDLPKDETISFTQEKFIHNGAEDDGKDEKTGYCANKVEEKDWNVSKIQSILSGGTCKTLNIETEDATGKKYNSKVRIIVRERVQFDFGYIYPSDYSNKEEEPIVFSGGSFNLNTNQELGAITKYRVDIDWDFADYMNYQNSEIPYFYNGDLNGSTDASAMEIRNKIANKLMKEIKEKYKELSIEVDTYDSNYVDRDGNGIELEDVPVGEIGIQEYKLNLHENANSKAILNQASESWDYEANENSWYFNNKKLSILFSGIELGKYRMMSGKNGIVEYGTGEGYEYNGYFTPLYYKNATFKFNFKQTDLSLIDGIELKYTGTCDNIKVENRIGKLRYRPINTTNPFPKYDESTGDGMASNWKEWYFDPTSSTYNQKRLKEQSFDKIYYSIEIDKNISKKIEEVNKSSLYTDWDNIMEDGSSTVVSGTTEGKFFDDNYALAVGSYCPKGVFDKNACDN